MTQGYGRPPGADRWTGAELSALVRRWRDEHQDDERLPVIVRSWCSHATRAGITVARQLAILAEHGIVIGLGDVDGAGILSPGLLCGYCGAGGRGRHAELCPGPWVTLGRPWALPRSWRRILLPGRETAS